MSWMDQKNPTLSALFSHSQRQNTFFILNDICLGRNTPEHTLHWRALAVLLCNMSNPKPALPSGAMEELVRCPAWAGMVQLPSGLRKVLSSMVGPQ